MNDAEAELYLREIAQFPLLDENEERELALRIARGDSEAREIMIHANLRLVVAIARRFASQALPFLDLVAEGNLGLLKAVERYRPETGNRFSTYATWWIKQGVRRALMNKVKNVRVPAHMARLVARWKAMAKELAQEFGRPPVPEEIAQRLDIPPEKIERVRQAQGATFSSVFSGIGSRTGEDSRENDLGEMLSAREGRDAEQPNAFSAGETEKLILLLECLPPREAEILRLRYALGDGLDQPMTLDAIGLAMDPPITRERIRQLEGQALNALVRLLGEPHESR